MFLDVFMVLEETGIMIFISSQFHESINIYGGISPLGTRKHTRKGYILPDI